MLPKSLFVFQQKSTLESEQWPCPAQIPAHCGQKCSSHTFVSALCFSLKLHSELNTTHANSPAVEQVLANTASIPGIYWIGREKLQEKTLTQTCCFPFVTLGIQKQVNKNSGESPHSVSSSGNKSYHIYQALLACTLQLKQLKI